MVNTPQSASQTLVKNDEDCIVTPNNFLTPNFATMRQKKIQKARKRLTFSPRFRLLDSPDISPIVVSSPPVGPNIKNSQVCFFLQ